MLSYRVLRPHDYLRVVRPSSQDMRPMGARHRGNISMWAGRPAITKPQASQEKPEHLSRGWGRETQNKVPR